MSPKNDRLLCAAAMMDWTQVALNGGPPCFHIEAGCIKFCARAERWTGHRPVMQGTVAPIHEFVSLRALIEQVERCPSQPNEHLP